MVRPFLLLTLLAASSCGTPPPEAFVTGRAAPLSGASVGRNAANEECTVQEVGSGVDIFCGAWQQPSARLRRAPGGPSAAEIAGNSPWRQGLEQRFACGAAQPATVLGDVPAAMLSCTRRQGGWPHVGLVAKVGNDTWLGDGVPAAMPVMERALAVALGRAPAGAARPAGTLEQQIQRVAQSAFSSGDIAQYEQLMALGATANQEERFAVAETAFRAALAVQERVVGAGNADSVGPLVQLALQLSNQGRHTDADALFARATELAPRAADSTARARVLHYRGLHAVNQRRYPDATALLEQAEGAYLGLLPPQMRAARAAPRVTVGGQTVGITPLDTTRGIAIEPQLRSALIGAIEARRNRANVARALGQTEAATALAASAGDLARSNGLEDSLVAARVSRTAGMAAGSGGNTGAADEGLARSAAGFARNLPRSRPLAETQMLRAAELSVRGRSETALPLCRGAIALLAELREGTSPDRLAGCLDTLAALAARGNAQALQAELFTAVQLAQGGVTAQQIGQAAARLAAGARDPRVAEAIRRRQDAALALADLYRERDEGTSGADARITEAQNALADADSAVQSAAPNFGQLVQGVVPASDILAALQPNEAFVVVVPTPRGGLTLVARDGRISVGRIGVPAAEVSALVRRIRASVEAGPQTPFDLDAAHALHRALFAEVAPALAGASAITVAPSGDLLALPFGLLVTERPASADLAQAAWLVRQAPIAHVPSPANFVALRRAAGTSRATRPWIGFGDFVPVSEAMARRAFPSAACAEDARDFARLPPLPFARRELEVARTLTGASAADMITGPAFTPGAVRAARLREFRILHFATHALLPAELRCLPEPAILAASPPGAADATASLLTASAVLNLELDADLVVLSACNSGGPGGTTAGESLSGLARSFFFAGARALLVTHWSVDDRTAAFLVADTLRRMGTGSDTGQALRAAQLALASDTTGLAHPFFWAPFAVIGATSGGRITTASVHTVAEGGL